jgi:hypothetical protein
MSTCDNIHCQKLIQPLTSVINKTLLIISKMYQLLLQLLTMKDHVKVLFITKFKKMLNNTNMILQERNKQQYTGTDVGH